MEQVLDRKTLVVGNWKLHGSFAFNRHLIADLRTVAEEVDGVECVVCPPSVYLSQLNDLLKDSSIMLGAQNVCADESGAFTGEVSASMLVEVGCQYVIIGHMERRILYGENDELISRKFKMADNAGLISVLCVGETLEQRDRGIERDVIRAQLRICLDKDVKNSFVVAYEPGWAIGSGRIAEAEQIGEMHGFIADCVGDWLKPEDILPRVVYGGSVKADNATDLFAIDHVDGVLVGGASLEADSFSRIIQAA